VRIEKVIPFQALIKDYKSDRIYRIFFAYIRVVWTFE